MKKSLVAVAVLGAFAGSAVAADVTLYGVVDEGLNYSHVNYDNLDVDSTNNFQMKQGQQAGSRWGLKGVEELGAGYKVGFNLESGFNADTGTFRTSGTLFDRESSLWVQTPFGKIAGGRIGSINQGVSSWGKVGRVSAFGTSYGDYVAQLGTTFSTAGVWNNMIAYETPEFAGFKVYAQYAMGSNDNENKSSSDRYYAIGATYDNGPIAGYFAVDSTNYQTSGATFLDADDIDDSLTVTAGGSYNFDVVKVFFGAQYFDEVTLKSIGGLTNGVLKSEIDGISKKELKELATKVYGALKVKGYGLNLSASAPVANGTALFGVGYVDAKLSDKMMDIVADEVGEGIDTPKLTRLTVSAGYVYSLSKRTNVYGVASYMQDKLDPKNDVESTTLKATTVMVGLRHNF